MDACARKTEGSQNSGPTLHLKEGEKKPTKRESAGGRTQQKSRRERIRDCKEGPQNGIGLFKRSKIVEPLAGVRTRQSKLK